VALEDPLDDAGAAPDGLDLDLLAVGHRADDHGEQPHLGLAGVVLAVPEVKRPLVAVGPGQVQRRRERLVVVPLDEVVVAGREGVTDHCRVELQVNLYAPGHERYDVTVPVGGIVPVGQIPFAAPGEIKLAHDTTAAGINVYTCTPDAGLVGRVAKAMAAFRAAGSQIALVPEATLTDEILAIWQAVCAPGGPEWVLVGTGDVTDAHPGASAPPVGLVTAGGITLGPNRAVLLDGRTGDVIAVQDKRYGFTILPDLRASYGLASAPKVTLDEGMIQGKKLTIIESRAGRVAILVCEDLDHITQDGAMLRELGVSLVWRPSSRRRSSPTGGSTRPRCRWPRTSGAPSSRSTASRWAATRSARTPRPGRSSRCLPPRSFGSRRSPTNTRPSPTRSPTRSGARRDRSPTRLPSGKPAFRPRSATGGRN
jgi:hypothetical protein